MIILIIVGLTILHSNQLAIVHINRLAILHNNSLAQVQEGNNSVIRLDEPLSENIILSSSGCNPAFSDCESQNVEWCTDVPPQGSDCATVQKLGFCESIDKNLCQKTCERCCQDKLLSFMTDCVEFVANGNCDKEDFQDICSLSCGRCLDEFSEAGVLRVFGGQSPLKLTSWVGSDPCSGEWEAVSCSASGNVEQLRLSSLGLKGFLMPELSVLQQLRVLDIGDNDFTGSISPEFSAWTRMQIFAAARNLLTGTIPSELSAWLLDMNWFSPDGNQLQGTLPQEFSKWTEINNFIVSDNSLTGIVPEEYSVWSSEMNYFYIKNNAFSGSLPVQYSKFNVQNFFPQKTNALCVPFDVSQEQGIIKC